MSSERYEINSDQTQNVSLEEQAKQQTVNATSENDANVEVRSNDNTNKSTDEVRPEWLPEKFGNAEELAKAYSELEKKFSTGKEQQPEVKEETNQTNNSLEPYYKEFADAGTLSEKSYTDLAKMGLDKNLVDGYIAGQKAIAEAEVKQVQSIVGGEENYKQLLDWSTKNLNEAEATAFNELLDTGSIEQIKLAVSAIANRAGISGQEKPTMFEGDTTASTADAFESIAQVTQAMNDPRYDKDPAYRKQVEMKIARSSVI
ncbi:scaffolding protein [Pelagibacter phage HTVC025P]|jgi:hypothetical protein|uniref:Scaffolding protein n=1 Tax=Pelagibacter phage HTVC025P TaxID=2259657 RepID=A0A4Y1NVW7_9CAUD|nr:scaffolding protein [Pelagibacter phage HTVC025P]